MSTLPSIPRSTTWDTLRESRNEAAILTLSNGLASQVPDVRHYSLQALTRRTEPAAHKAVLLNWEHFDERDIEFLRSEAQQFAEPCKTLMASGTLSQKRLVLQAIANLDVCDAIDVLLDLVADPRHALATQATQSLLDMCTRWGQQARAGKNVRNARRSMLEKLHAKMVLFHEHKNTHIVDAWLSLVHWEDALHRGVITDPRMDVYPALMQRIEKSDHPAVLQLLAGYAGRSAAPKRVTEILVERTDPELAVEIAKAFDADTLPAALKRLKRLPPLACLQNIGEHFHQPVFEIEKRLWMVISASSDDLALVLRGAIKLSGAGTSDARQAAADVVCHCRHPGLEVVVPAIQESLLDAASDDSLGSLIQQIAGWVESPSVTLQGAAEWFFRDFTLENLLEQIRHWPSQMCKAMARLVKVDDEVTDTLTRQLQNPAPKKRLAALQVTQLLGCADQITDALTPLLEDPRLEVRVKVIDLLSALGHEPLEEMLPQLLDDASTDIQDAANRAIRRIRRMRQKPAESS